MKLMVQMGIYGSCLATVLREVHYRLSAELIRNVHFFDAIQSNNLYEEVPAQGGRERGREGRREDEEQGS